MTDKRRPLLWGENLHKAYTKAGRRIDVLKGASLRLGEGEMVSVTGASGAGKSTLLHVLGTLDAMDAGTLHYRGTPLHALRGAELCAFRNRQLGFVFQFHHLLPDFDALENVMMPAWIGRMPSAEAKRRAQTALDEVGLAHRQHHRPKELSGGEQQRVALARALVLEPPLLLADEVTGNLDEKTAEGIHALLFSLNQTRGVSIVVVTHNRGLAERMPRRLVLSGGLLQETSS